MAIINLANLQAKLQQSNARWKAKSTRVSLLPDDQRRRLLGAVPSQEVIAMAKQPTPSLPETAFQIAKAVDWRNGGHVSAVKDQGGCGSCVSFGCIGLIESMVHIEKSVWNDLSEADSHFCSNHGANCRGWWPDQCIDQVIRRGVSLENQFTYASAFPNNNIWNDPPACRLNPRPRSVTRVRNRITLDTAAKAKKHLSEVGPIVGCMDVFTDFFSYSSGIYEHVTGSREGGHCMLIYGYSETDDCWLVKNSWGNDWGDNGFVKIAYSSFLMGNDFYPMYGASEVILPARVWSDVSTTLAHPLNGKIYFFRGDRYQRFDLDIEQIDKDNARIGSDGWKGVWTTGVDAALVHPRNGKAYFFRGDRYQRFDFQSDCIDKDNALIGVDGWKVVWTTGIHAALVHPNGKAYFFRGDRYQRFDFQTDRVDKDNARIGIDGWKGVWTTGVDAALVHPRNGKAYFFRDDRYQRFDFQSDCIDKDNALIGVDGW